MNFFFDSSALVKLYHQEDGTAFLEDLLRKYSTNVVVTLFDLACIEFRSAVQKYVRQKALSLQRARELFRQFENDDNLYNVVEVASSVNELAVTLLETAGSRNMLKTLDSLQLASAIISHQSFPVDYFVSSDSNLLFVANEFFPTINPDSEIFLPQSKG